ncbi:MAG TPA: restriction endonuclease [Bacillota bacterium]|nr:restriction endonuclease [Bacillota bacterium]
MPVPDFQTIMLPLLAYVSDGKEHSLREIIEAIASQFNLSDIDRKELLPSGQQAVIDNRVGWAATHLKMAGLLISKRRGFYAITDRGRNALSQNIDKLNIKYLKQFPEYVDFLKPKKNISDQKLDTSNDTDHDADSNSELSPIEKVEIEYQKIKDELSKELLDMIKSCSPSFFEKLVVELLVRMGYGGSRQDAVKAIGKSGDEGIDGIIKEDRLGLDVVYIQAKRWEGTVGRPEIQKFSGALLGQRAKKGVFITTSSFTKEAYDYVSRIDNKIVLIDGVQLTQLMIENNLGVSTVALYDIKKIDNDYFTGE